MATETVAARSQTHPGPVSIVRPGPWREAARPTTAVVLAAGRGARLSEITGGAPKASVAIAGGSLAERLQSSLRLAGIRRAVIVTGYNAAEVEAAFAGGSHSRPSAATDSPAVDLAEVTPRVEFVHAREWQLGNGASALAARDALDLNGDDARFLIVMADHLFEDDLLSRVSLAAVPSTGHGVAVEIFGRGFAGPTAVDLDDATRVLIASNRRVQAIGKHLIDWNAVDVGAHLATAALFDALECSIRGGRYTLTDGIALLARGGAARAIDVTGCRWVDVDTADEFRRAIAVAEANGPAEQASSGRKVAS